MSSKLKGRIEFSADIEMGVPTAINPHMIGALLFKAQAFIQDAIVKSIQSSAKVVGITVRFTNPTVKIAPEEIIPG